MDQIGGEIVKRGRMSIFLEDMAIAPCRIRMAMIVNCQESLKAVDAVFVIGILCMKMIIGSILLQRTIRYSVHAVRSAGCSKGSGDWRNHAL